MSSHSASEAFVRKSLEIQYNLAVKVKSVLSKQIYVFDVSETFKNAETIIVEQIRVLKTAQGKYGVLSGSAQSAFSSSNEYQEFSDKTFDSDSIGLYI